MPLVGFEPTFPMFEWTKIFNALDLATTVISNRFNYCDKIRYNAIYTNQLHIRYLILKYERMWNCKDYIFLLLLFFHKKTEQ